MSNYDLFSPTQVNQYGNHMVMTNVNKQTRTKYMNVDTANCDEYYAAQINPTSTEYNNAAFTVTLPEKINSVKSMSVCSVELQLPMSSYYNISSTLGNNCFKLSEEFGENGYNEYMVVIPDGFYTYSQILSQINILIPKPEDIYVIFENSNSKTHVYMNSVVNYYNIYFAVDAAGNFDKNNFKNKLGWLLGFRETTYRINPSTYDAIATNNFLGQGIYSENIYSPVFSNNSVYKNLYLSIDEFSKGSNNSFQCALPFSIVNKDLIAKIGCNNTAYGDVLYANLLNGLLISDYRVYGGKVDLQKLVIKLLDEKGQIIKMDGYNFTFTLKIEYEP